MQVSQGVFTSANPPHFDHVPQHEENQLVLLFGSVAMLGERANFDAVRAAYPGALIVGCSTAGEIHDTTVEDDTLVVTAVAFAHTRVRLSKVDIDDAGHSFSAGQALVAGLPAEDLAHVLIFSDGLRVNGTELVRGLKDRLPPHVEVTGGLSADGTNFKRTLVCADAAPAEGQIAAVGLYGARIRVAYGSLGGWDPFGPERRVTRSSGNVLFDLDGKPALELYKSYLGGHAAGLPATGLLFPLSLRHTGEDGETVGASGGVVRTILGVNEAEQSMTFAGDMPEGSYARLMRANFERLIDGASGAARICREGAPDGGAELALLISCVGRKLVLMQRIEEEVEGVREVLGARAVFAGFYSYGEISPHVAGQACELHNQTMTITTFREI